MVDGVADTDNFFASASGLPSEFSIQEVKVQTAFTRRNMAGLWPDQRGHQVGTNLWHGQAYDYIQNNAFDPRSPLAEEQHVFAGGAVPAVTPWKQNQFGGTLAVRSKYMALQRTDKSFWFFAYDGGRRRTNNNQNPIQVPTRRNGRRFLRLALSDL